MEKIGSVAVSMNLVSDSTDAKAIGRCSIIDQYIRIGCRALMDSERLTQQSGDLGGSIGMKAVGTACCFQGFELLLKYIVKREGLKIDTTLKEKGQHPVSHYLEAIQQHKGLELEKYLRDHIDPKSLYCPKNFWSVLIKELHKEFMNARYIGVGKKKSMVNSRPAHHVAHVYNAFVHVFPNDGLLAINLAE